MRCSLGTLLSMLGLAETIGDVRLAHFVFGALLSLQSPAGTIGCPSELISRPRARPWPVGTMCSLSISKVQNLQLFAQTVASS